MKIGYFDFINFKGNYKGGILVVDKSTKPLEFRATTNLEIDDLQKILYGDTFEETLIKENFAVDLIKALKIRPDIVLVNQKQLLTIRNKVNTPVGFLQKYDPFKATYKNSKLIKSSSGKFDTLILLVNKEDLDILEDVSRRFENIYKNFNILEPFSRVKKALEYLIKG